MIDNASSDYTGSLKDMVGRMRACLPVSWFPATVADESPEPAPVLKSLLSGLAASWVYCFQLLGYARQQARLRTMAATFLDLFAADLFGTEVKRQPFENDADFRDRISANLLMGRATRDAVMQRIGSLTEVSPLIFEPRSAADAGGYGSAIGGYGSNRLPFQFLISVDANGGPIRRETIASYLDQDGRLKIAPRHAARPIYVNGARTSFLIEDAAVNLLKNSSTWTGWSRSLSGASAQWVLDPRPAIALWSDHPVMTVSLSSAGPFIGPAIQLHIDDGIVCASVWVRIPSDHAFSDLRLELEGATRLAAPADLTIVDRWQRVSICMDAPPPTNGLATMRLVGDVSVAMLDCLLTQCWQIEPGSVATSYIPSAGQIGVRDRDRIVGSLDAIQQVPLDASKISQTLRQTMPAGSIAWLSLTHSQ